MKKILDWWNHQSDSWYTAKPICVDKALKGREINLLDIKRLRASAQAGDMHFQISKKDQSAFNKFSQSLKKAESDLTKEVKQKKELAQIVNEMDITSQQLKIAKYSAFAALASAAATALLAYITLVRLEQ